MYIQKVKLENFRNYEKAEIETISPDSDENYLFF